MVGVHHTSIGQKTVYGIRSAGHHFHSCSPMNTRPGPVIAIIGITMLGILVMTGFAQDARTPGDEPSKVTDTIGGSVVDEEGIPVEGATVEIYVQATQEIFATSVLPANFNNRLSCVTDAEGTWHIGKVPIGVVPDTSQNSRTGKDTYRFYVTHPQYLFAEFSSNTERFFGTDAEFRQQKAKFVLKRGHVMRGMVRDEDGLGVPGVTIQRFLDVLARPDPSATTDAHGRYVLKAARPGNLWMHVRSEGYALLHQKANVSGDATLDFVLKPANTVISKLRDESGKPLTRGWVNFMPEGSTGRPDRIMLVRADHNGIITWDQAPAGESVAIASAEGFQPQTKKIKPGEEAEFILSPQPRQPTITLKVTDAGTGKPLTDCVVSTGTLVSGSRTPYWPSWQPKSTGDPIRPSTAPGEFRARIDANYGAYELMFRVKRDGYAPVITAPVNPKKGNATVNVALREQPYCQVSVLKKDGSPAANAGVYVCWRGNAMELTDFALDRTEYSNRYLELALATGEDGRCAIPPSGDDATVLVAHEDGYASATYGELRKNGAMKLLPYGRVEAIVKKDGRPAPNVKFQYQGSMPLPNSRTVMLTVSCESDAEGRIALPRVFPTQQARLFESLPPLHAGEDRALIMFTETKSIGGEQTAHFDLEARGSVARTITGRFTLRDGGTFAMPIRGGSKVSLRRADGTLSYMAEFYREGRFECGAVLPGSYRMRFPNYSDGPFRYAFPGGSEWAVTIPPAAPGEEGKPFDLGNLVVEDRQNAPQKVASTNGRAELVVRVLKEGKPVLDDQTLVLAVSGESTLKAKAKDGVFRCTVRAGAQTLQVGYCAQDGVRWFSPLTHTNMSSDAGTEVTVSLVPGIRVAGRVADEVSRPIKDAQVSVYVSTVEEYAFARLLWIDSTPLREDGSFEFPSLPPGIVRFHVVGEEWMSLVRADGGRRGRPWLAGVITKPSDDLVIPMERTGTCEVTVLNAQGSPVASASVFATPSLLLEGIGTLVPGVSRRLSLEEVLAQKPANPLDAKAIKDRRAAMDESMQQFHILTGNLRKPSRILTDAQGRATIRGVPPSVAGSSVSAYLPTGPMRIKRVPLDPIKPGETTQITISLDP